MIETTRLQLAFKFSMYILKQGRPGSIYHVSGREVDVGREPIF